MVDRIFDVSPVGGLSDSELTQRVVGYAAQITVLTARFSELLAEFDERHAWSGEGIASCAQWLSWRVGMSQRAAREHVRVARALRELPLIADAFAGGRLSYSKVRALTRVATPVREQELVNLAVSATATQVEKVVRSIRRSDSHNADGDGIAEAESTGSFQWNDDGTLTVKLHLTSIDGARFLAAAVRGEYERTRAIDDPDLPSESTAGAAAVPRDRADGRRVDLWRHVPSNIAPAVVAVADMVHSGMAMPEFAPGAEIVVNTFVGEAPVTSDPHLQDGPALSDAERDEVECGAAVREVPRRRSGVVVNWGRKRRAPTTALLRIVTARDRGCAHPGCGRTRHLHVHHVQPWSAGGTTDPDNLIVLCSSHHRALHLGVFGITSLGGQRFRFHRSDGSTIERAPTMTPPDGWRPRLHLADDVLAPTGGGRLDLGYATEVLHAVWAWKDEQEPAAA